MRKILFISSLLLALCMLLGLTSCNVTRVVTTEAKTFTSGDSTIQIVTKTTEMYDATKKSSTNF